VLLSGVGVAGHLVSDDTIASSRRRRGDASLGYWTPGQRNREGGTRSDWLGMTRAPYTPRAVRTVLSGTKCPSVQTSSALLA